MRLTTDFLDATRLPIVQRVDELKQASSDLDSFIDDLPYAATPYDQSSFTDQLVGQIPPRELRGWRDKNPWIYAAIATMKQLVGSASWTVQPIDITQPWNKDAVVRITNRLRQPNPGGRNNSFDTMIEALADDVLCLDVAGLRPFPAKGEPSNLTVLDGGRIWEDPRWQTDRDGHRYVYREREGAGRGEPLNDSELLCINANITSYHIGGISPLKVLHKILQAEFDTFKQVYILQKSRTPPSIFKMPNATKKQVDKAKSLWINELSGRVGMAFMAVPADATVEKLGSTNLAETGTFAFYDMLIRAIAAAFRITTMVLNWLQDVNRATAQEQSNIIDDGVVALLRLIQGHINRSIVPRFQNSDNIGFFYTQLLAADTALPMSTIRELAGRLVNPFSVNDLREAGGKKKTTFLDKVAQSLVDEPLIQVANGQMASISIAVTLPQYQSWDSEAHQPPPNLRPDQQDGPAPQFPDDQKPPKEEAVAQNGGGKKSLDRALQQYERDAVSAIDGLFTAKVAQAREVVQARG